MLQGARGEAKCQRDCNDASGERGEGVWCGCGVGRYHPQCNTASGGKLKGGAEKGRVVGRQVPQGVPLCR